MTYIPNKYKEKIICFDYDGLVGPNDGPIYVSDEFKALITRLESQGYTLVVNTSRDSLHAQEIAAATGIAQVHTGKPIADLYIDDKGLLTRADLLEGLIERHFNDHRDYYEKMAAAELDSPYARNIYNVPENPAFEDKKDNDFAIVVPLTSGMDSTTLWQMALDSGMPCHAVYLDMGQSYANIEGAMAAAIATDETHNLISLHEKGLPFKEFQHILAGRNAIIIDHIAQWMNSNRLWGELWLGNLAGECPIVGGDKSRRFLNDIQALLNLRAYDVRIETPLIGMDKPDLVTWWANRGHEQMLWFALNTKSCFDPTVQQCGKCQSCFRKWAAFIVKGLDITPELADKDIKTNFKPFAEKYKAVMDKAILEGDYSHYSPARIGKTLEAIGLLEWNAP